MVNKWGLSAPWWCNRKKGYSLFKLQMASTKGWRIILADPWGAHARACVYVFKNHQLIVAYSSFTESETIWTHRRGWKKHPDVLFNLNQLIVDCVSICNWMQPSDELFYILLGSSCIHHSLFGDDVLINFCLTIHNTSCWYVLIVDLIYFHLMTTQVLFPPQTLKDKIHVWKYCKWKK